MQKIRPFSQTCLFLSFELWRLLGPQNSAIRTESRGPGATKKGPLGVVRNVRCSSCKHFYSPYHRRQSVASTSRSGGMILRARALELWPWKEDTKRLKPTGAAGEKFGDEEKRTRKEKNTTRELSFVKDPLANIHDRAAPLSVWRFHFASFRP